MSIIFHIDENNKALPVHMKKYEREDDLQKLIADNPEILAGELVDPESPREWILIAREMGVPEQEGGNDKWFLDHLFLDQDGIPTLIEVKRSTNTQIRREVVGQMMDYAANATLYWPVDRLRGLFEESHEDAFAFLRNKLGVARGEENAYWEKVDNNLRLGKLRLLFVADEIPGTLQRIIEFLNEQMTRTEVLGIEIRQYISHSGQITLVPQVVGRTMSSVQIKKTPGVQWTEDTYLSKVQNVSGDDGQNVVRKLFSDLQDMNLHLWFGSGAKEAVCIPTYYGTKRQFRLFDITCSTNVTKITIPLNEYTAPLDTKEKKMELIKKINSIAHVSFDPEEVNCKLKIDCRYLKDEISYGRFVAICKDMLVEIQNYE